MTKLSHAFVEIGDDSTKQYNNQSGISIEMSKQRYSKLAPEMYITKEGK